MPDKIRNFRDLDIWKKGIEIVKDTYRIAGGFPKQEFYGLVSQMQKSAVSIPSNIAEGFNRFHNKEYKQFLYVALGSCAELEGGEDDLSVYRRIISQGARFLRKTGFLALEMGYKQAERIRELIIDQEELLTPQVIPDYKGIERVILTKKRVIS